jgi:hypothetical protein
MILINITCAACPSTLRLLIATKVTEEGAPTSDADMGDLLQKLADRRWTLQGPLCSDCADKMRVTIN